jgi:endogenous inhibitor of DNA gyrase (YacG/DUF329 family)
MPPDKSNPAPATPCPICKASVTEPAPGQPRGTFPFCSERCKLIDLGRWLGGKYQIPVVERDESDVDPDR